MRYERSKRISRLRERAMNPDYEINFPWERNFLFVQGWMAAKGRPMPVRTAEALANVIERMPIKAVPGELLIGEHGSANWFFPNIWGIDPKSLRDLTETDLDSVRRDKLICWCESDYFSWLSLQPCDLAPPELKLAEEHHVLTIWGTQLNHSIRDYEKVLKLGFEGIKAQVDASLSAIHPTDPTASALRGNLLAWSRLCEAAAGLGKRHACAAREMASHTDDEHERAEWEQIAETCEQVPARPARTFREALQSLWFAHMITVWEDGINANGIGRFDQFLWPYLERDLDSGAITEPQAMELLAALWVKLYQAYDVQQMMIGGQLPDGADATNPLSYMVLDVTEGMEFVRCLSARLHKASPREFVARCVDLIAQGGGIPFFFNDEAIIPALVSNGIPVEDARNYAAIGCIEITIPGKTNPHAASAWINLAKVLELALNDGRDMLDGAEVGPKTGTLADFDSMEAVLSAFTTQLEHFTDWTVYGCNSRELAARSQFRMPYLSLLTDDCITRGTDIVEGGAHYNYHSCAAMGIPNVADSLAALDLAIYRENRVSRDTMLQALRTDYVNHQDLFHHLRQKMPKYGNDQDLPDGYAARIARQFCELLTSYRSPSDGRFLAHLFTFTLMLEFGAATAASPEGRKAGEPLAYSLSPVQGRDKEGLTALLSSLSRIPHDLAAASSSAIVEADPALFSGKGKEIFTDLLIASIHQGIGQLQFNVVDVDTLRAAQASPERYENLCVRVSGFSQKFNLLDAAMQEHIIARTKHRR